MSSWIGSFGISVLESSAGAQRLRIIFRKGPEARFLSHLDLMATLEYAMRRAGLPLALSEGFSPRPRMSLASPLPVGYIGERELLEITLKEPLPPDDVRAVLGPALPEGIEIVEVLPIAATTKKAAARIVAAVYRVDLPQPIPDLTARVAVLLGRSTLPVVETREDGIRTRDLRPLVRAFDAVSPTSLRLAVALNEAGTVRPEQILTLMDLSPDGARITRETIELATSPIQ